MFMDPAVRRITKRTASGWLRTLLRLLGPYLNFPPTHRTVFVVSKEECPISLREIYAATGMAPTFDVYGSPTTGQFTRIPGLTTSNPKAATS